MKNQLIFEGLKLKQEEVVNRLNENEAAIKNIEVGEVDDLLRKHSEITIELYTVESMMAEYIQTQEAQNNA